MPNCIYSNVTESLITYWAFGAKRYPRWMNAFLHTCNCLTFLVVLDIWFKEMYKAILVDYRGTRITSSFTRKLDRIVFWVKAWYLIEENCQKLTSIRGGPGTLFHEIAEYTTYIICTFCELSDKIGWFKRNPDDFLIFKDFFIILLAHS